MKEDFNIAEYLKKHERPERYIPMFVLLWDSTNSKDKGKLEMIVYHPGVDQKMPKEAMKSVFKTAIKHFEDLLKAL